MPGMIVLDELPLRLTEPWLLRPRLLPTGTASPASRSGTTFTPVVAAGLRVALPLLLTPPTTWILPALILALPLSVRAVFEFESTTRLPGMLMLALPERDKAPPAVWS